MATSGGNVSRRQAAHASGLSAHQAAVSGCDSAPGSRSRLAEKVARSVLSAE
ncbi:MAG: hypothetical protein HQL87_16740 [Magnetococcales bacterium]|nr:hypothetical protein [Magnetococcales bacterium]